MSTIVRRRPCGAEPTSSGVTFRVWAPKRTRVRIRSISDHRMFELDAEGDGYFSGHAEGWSTGDQYFFRLDDDEYDYPDPVSRFQPQGVHGPSQVVDPQAFEWTDGDWPGVELRGQVIYELHIGCFTHAGTWQAAMEKLPLLSEVGVTVVELMPVSEFDGQFGWGYDGVKWYAPTHLYGAPDDFRRFVDAAHALGMGVILDVVYNHFGPSGNYTAAFSPFFISQRHPTEWGDALNFDGAGASGVREFVVNNAAYWIDEYHLDGLRLDATQSIFDDSSPHVLADLSVAAREAAAGRKIIIVAENETQEVRHVQSVDDGGFGLDGLWNDDFHHTCRVAATGHAEFYYADYAGSAQEIISAIRYGYLFQGQYSHGTRRMRGTPAWDIEGWRFVTFLQNHDQVANSARGSRLPDLTSPGINRALTALWLLSPGTPMFFMGQEFGSRTPFRYFADHEVELANMVRAGRFEALRQFPRIAGWHADGLPLPDPADESTFTECKLDWSKFDKESPAWRLHYDLLQLRKFDPMISRLDNRLIHSCVIRDGCFALRWHADNGEQDRLLLVNFGRDYRWLCVAEPLVAPPPGRDWRILFSSEDARYEGSGTALLDTKNWNIPGHSAILLHCVENPA